MTSLSWVGCATPPHRAAQHRKGFEKLETETQERLLERRIQEGDTREMVYIALGSPISQIPIAQADKGNGERWEYFGYVEKPKFENESEDAEMLPIYRTQNDLIWPGPFSQSEYQRITIDFFEEQVTAIKSQTLASDSYINRSVPSMYLPQSLHSPAPDEPAPDDSSASEDLPAEPPLE